MVETKICTKFIKDVSRVPNLKKNHLSIGQRIENEHSLNSKKDTCKIYDSWWLEIGQVNMEKRNKRFPISFKPNTNISMKAEVDDSWL